MKNIRQDLDDSLRPEYRRSDFGEMIQGKHAATPIEFAELVRILLACIGEDEDLKFINQPENQRFAQPSNYFTYTVEDANQITLRYYINDQECIEERIATQCCITTPEERAKFQDQLLHHVRALKSRAGLP
jgi:hypothetical protein